MSQIILSDLIKQFPDCDFKGDKSLLLKKVVSLKDSLGLKFSDSISWLSDRVGEAIEPNQLHLGLLVLTRTMYDKFSKADCNFLISENPRATFTKILSLYFKKTWPAKIEPSAIINPSSKIGSNCYIGHHVIVDENCTIGKNTVVLHNTTILANTVIGDNCVIGCNNTIGNYGFGYEKDNAGEYQLLEHLGKVIIHDNVEIHNNTCIDRGVLGDTEIHDHVKIDNLVHIAHGVVIERNALVIANAMIGGSAHLGKNTWIAPSVSVKNQIKIADDTFTGMGAVILKNTEEKSLMIGNPATSMDEYKKWSEIKKNLTKDNDKQ